MIFVVEINNTWEFGTPDGEMDGVSKKKEFCAIKEKNNCIIHSEVIKHWKIWKILNWLISSYDYSDNCLKKYNANKTFMGWVCVSINDNMYRVIKHQLFCKMYCTHWHTEWSEHSVIDLLFI